MSVFFTSDLHLGHAKVAALRGFPVVTDHDDAILGNIAASVGPRDQLWVLGDLAASSPTYALSRLAELGRDLHLVLGNHDKAHPMHRDAHRHLRTYLEVFQSVAQSARRRVDGTEVLLSHFPYHRDRDEPRHTQWRLRDEGRWLLHGHTHGTERATVTGFRRTGPLTREIHVGVDAWDLTPVSLETISALIKEHS